MFTGRIIRLLVESNRYIDSLGYSRERLQPSRVDDHHHGGFSCFSVSTFPLSRATGINPRKTVVCVNTDQYSLSPSTNSSYNPFTDPNADQHRS